MEAERIARTGKKAKEKKGGKGGGGKKKAGKKESGGKARKDPTVSWKPMLHVPFLVTVSLAIEAGWCSHGCLSVSHACLLKAGMSPIGKLPRT